MGAVCGLIAAWVVKIKERQESTPRRGGGGRGAQRLAVEAYRHLWRYLVEKRWASENVAAALNMTWLALC